MPTEFTQNISTPDLVIGLVGPIGVDLEFIQSSIQDILRGYDYDTSLIKVTSLMRELKVGVDIDEANLITSYNTKIDFANKARKYFDSKSILSALSISAISRSRDQSDVESGRGTAYIVRQLKTPDEVKLFRSVYGRQFILVSIYSNPSRRLDNLTSDISIKSKGTIDTESAKAAAKDLIERDKKEDDEFGQDVSGTFHQADLFIDMDKREAAQTAIDRFFKALFGSNDISPSHDEYAMYLAKSASLRSIDISRQIGAAIFSESGEVISLGANEVPKAGGGTYWPGDDNDSRDVMIGHDPNELEKVSVFADLIGRLYDDKRLSTELQSKNSLQAVVTALLDSKESQTYKDSRVMDIIEFGRIIHAEMSAITDAARNGLAIRGATLYSTAFPCHLCAKHIVSSGISKVVYLEPYPKSYAERLHSDSIQVDDPSSTSKVKFQPFMGISPFRYRDLFEKGKRKDVLGKAVKWKHTPRGPLIDTVVPSHYAAEKFVSAKLAELLMARENSQQKKE